MGNGGFITANLVTGITGTTPETAFPADNLKDGSSSRPCRWAAGSLSITVAASGGCTGIGICGHNLRTGGSCTINGLSVPVLAGQSIWHKFSAPTSSAALVINGGGVSKIGIGEIVMGVATVFSHNFSYGWNEGRVYVNDIHETEFGMLLPYEKSNSGQYQLPFQLLDSAAIAAMKTLYQQQRGSLTPFLMIFDIDAGPCCFGRLTNHFNTTFATPGVNTLNLEFREDPIGAFLS